MLTLLFIQKTLPVLKGLLQGDFYLQTQENLHNFM
jgi:hypothetical protein